MEKDGRHNNSIQPQTTWYGSSRRFSSGCLLRREYNKNSFERLDDIIDAGILPKGRAQDLKDAMGSSLVRITTKRTILITMLSG